MRLGISNIAWDISHDEDVAHLLNQYQIDAIDIAPGKYFSDFKHVSDQKISHVKDWWAARNIEITGMQALLFGSANFNMFGPSEIQEAMLSYLAAVCRIGAGLGALRLVFGAPKNRDRSQLTDQETMDVAFRFFRRLGDIAQSYGVLICLEPNPAYYGANFMTTSTETAKVIELVAHPAIQMQLDTGSLTINNEDAAAVLSEYAQLIGHIHLSEPGLVPLGESGAGHQGTDHHKIYAALKQHLKAHLVCIEMLAAKNESHLTAIERALTLAVNIYRPRLKVTHPA